MSIEEKAKAYDEALEKARTYRDNAKIAEDYVAVARYENIFPELRESEDERIRKRIYGLIYHNDALLDKDELLAWLEKQKKHHIPWYDYQKSKEAGYTIVPNEEYEQLIKKKEQKPIMDKHLAIYLSSVIARDIDRVMDGMCMSSMECVALENAFLKGDFDEVSKFLEKKYTATTKAEQKPVEIHNPTDEEVESWENELTEFKKFATKQAKENQPHISYTRDIMWENFCSELLSFVNSRKPAEWSEEDEYRIRQIERIAQQAGCTQKLQEEIHDWLKSLRPRKNPIVAVDAEQLLKILHKRQVWSEEDEKVLSQAIETLEHENYSILAEKLKSIRPSWKPSKEQMEALLLAIKGKCPPTSYMSRRLEDLYDGLVNTYRIDEKLD